MAQSEFLERPHKLPHFAPCYIDGVVCADAILHSEHGVGPGAGYQIRRGGRRAAGDHV